MKVSENCISMAQSNNPGGGLRNDSTHDPRTRYQRVCRHNKNRAPLVDVSCLPARSCQQVLEEVIVTAQKREQNVQDVGIAITAFSGAQLKELRVTESTDVAYMSAGVFRLYPAVAPDRPASSRFAVSPRTTSPISAENPNATYVDEGYIGFRQ